MGLMIERGYMNKQNQWINFTTPQVRISGKNMNDGEEQTFQVSFDEIKVYPPSPNSQYPTPNYVMGASHNGQPIQLKLSGQAYKAIDALKPLKGDMLTVKKAYFTNSKTGALMPIIEAVLAPNPMNDQRRMQMQQQRAQMPPNQAYPNMPLGTYPQAGGGQMISTMVNNQPVQYQIPPQPMQAMAAPQPMQHAYAVQAQQAAIPIVPNYDTQPKIPAITGITPQVKEFAETYRSKREVSVWSKEDFAGVYLMATSTETFKWLAMIYDTLVNPHVAEPQAPQLGHASGQRDEDEIGDEPPVE